VVIAIVSLTGGKLRGHQEVLAAKTYVSLDVDCVCSESWDLVDKRSGWGLQLESLAGATTMVVKMHDVCV
jgi:hypothetical protein